MEPFWAPNRAQIGLRSAQDRLQTRFFQKTCFFTKLLKTNGPRRFLDPKMASKMAKNRPKTASRRSYIDSFFASIFVFDFGPFWVRFGLPLGPLLGAQMGSFSHRFFDDFCMSFEERPKSGQERPRAAQERPRAVQEPPKSGQEGPKSGPGVPRSLPKRMFGGSHFLNMS